MSSTATYTTSAKYPNARNGMAVPEGGPGSNTLVDELNHMQEKLRNISDEDLYRVYHERWVNPDRQKTGWSIARPDFLPFESRHMKVLNRQLQAGSRSITPGGKDAVKEYVRDRNALERERLLHYMIDPQTELLEDEALLGALFPDIENSKYPAYEMYKYKIKIEDLHPYTYAIWDNVRQFYAREDTLDQLHSMDEPTVGTHPYSNPIAAYESLYDPVNQLLRTVSARTGEFMQHGNPAHEFESHPGHLYDYQTSLEHAADTEPWEKELPGPPPEMFVMYAKAMKEKAEQDLRWKAKTSNRPYDVQNMHRIDESELDYWTEIVAPFEYEPKEAPLDRPIFMELPHVEITRLGFGTRRPKANAAHHFWKNWKLGKGQGDDNRHKYGENGEWTLAAAARTVESPGSNFMLPKLSSEVTFDYISYTPSNPDKVIDSTYRIGEPIKVRWGMDSLPKCLSMTLGNFPKGSRFQVTCPPRLLFGYDGWPKRGYPANSEVTFDIEVRDVTVPVPLKSNVVFYQDHDNPNSAY